MKKIITLILMILCVIVSYSQYDDIQREKLKAEVALFADLYFIWRNDTIDFTALLDGKIISKEDSTRLYVTPKQMADYILATNGHDSVLLAQSALDGGLSQVKQLISFSEVSGILNGYLSATNFTWLSAKLDSVTKNNTLLGDGTIGDPLRVDPILLANSRQVTYSIRLPNSSTVAGRVVGAAPGTDYDATWTLAAGTNTIDLQVTHGMGRRVANVNVCTLSGTVEQLLRPFAGAYSGWQTLDSNTLLINSLATTPLALRIYITFE